MKRSFCILPFIQTVVRTDGMISPCCIIPGWLDIKQNTIQDFWHDPGVKEIQQAMMRDEMLEVCAQCYQSEQQSGQSMRLDNLEKHEINMELTTDQILDQHRFRDLPAPRYIEMHVNNVCNLKCLTCRPEDSSMFLAENLQLAISDHRQTDYTIPEDIMVQRLRELQDHQLDYLDLRGGESMLVPQVKTFLHDLPDQHNIKMLRLQTNGTILLTDEWQAILRKFTKVGMMLSVDAYGDDNHYIRYPANWSTIEQNLAIMKKMSNVYFCISCTLSNLNLPVLDRLISWCEKQQVPFYWSELSLPNYFHYSNLPAEIYNESLARLKSSGMFDSLRHKPLDQQLWKKFCQMISMRDNHRKNSIFSMLPQLQTHWLD